jgi:hypothetical protein
MSDETKPEHMVTRTYYLTPAEAEVIERFRTPTHNADGKITLVYHHVGDRRMTPQDFIDLLAKGIREAAL